MDYLTAALVVAAWLDIARRLRKRRWAGTKKWGK